MNLIKNFNKNSKKIDENLLKKLNLNKNIQKRKGRVACHIFVSKSVQFTDLVWSIGVRKIHVQPSLKWT